MGQGGGGGKREASSFVDTDVTSCEHLHLNSFSWIRDVWKRVSRFTSGEKSQTIPSYISLLSKTIKRFFANSTIINPFELAKRNYHDYRYDAQMRYLYIFIIDTRFDSKIWNK